MTASTTSSIVSNNSDPYFAQNDEAELKRLQQLHGNAPLGDILDDASEQIEMLKDMGFNVDFEAR